MLFSALIAFPFVELAPVTAIAPDKMPQQSVILQAINAFYSKYAAVRKDCVVFSFTSDIWYEVNISSAQINFLEGANSSIKNSLAQYRCAVLDYGYWCVVAIRTV